MRHAADIRVGFAGSKCTSPAFALVADVPAGMRAGALEAFGGRFGGSRDMLTLRKQGVNTPLKVNRPGHCPGSGRFRGGPIWEYERPRSFSIVFRMGLHERTSRRVQWRITSSLRGGWPVSVRAATYLFVMYGRDVGRFDGWLPVRPDEDFHEISFELGPRVGAAASTTFGGLGRGQDAFVYEVLEQREECRSFDKAPHVPVAGPPLVPS